MRRELDFQCCEVHLGAKRKDSTKEAISKSRVGSKSKVAKTWIFISPSGVEYVFKGGFGKFCDMMGLSTQRMRNHIGRAVGPVTNQGHVNEKVINCIGWYCNETNKSPNYEFFYIDRFTEKNMTKI